MNPRTPPPSALTKLWRRFTPAPVNRTPPPPSEQLLDLTEEQMRDIALDPRGASRAEILSLTPERQKQVMIGTYDDNMKFHKPDPCLMADLARSSHLEVLMELATAWHITTDAGLHLLSLGIREVSVALVNSDWVTAPILFAACRDSDPVVRAAVCRSIHVTDAMFMILVHDPVKAVREEVRWMTTEGCNPGVWRVLNAMEPHRRYE